MNIPPGVLLAQLTRVLHTVDLHLKAGNVTAAQAELTVASEKVDQIMKAVER